MQRPPASELAPSAGTEKATPDKDRAQQDALLDEELEETFPASDPLPWTHRNE